MDKDLNKIVEALKAAGYQVVRTQRRHWEVYTADRDLVTTFAGAAGDRRSILNGLAPTEAGGVRPAAQAVAGEVTGAQVTPRSGTQFIHQHTRRDTRAGKDRR